MAKVNGKAFTAALKQGFAQAEDTFLSSLQAAWQRSLEKAGANAANRFAVTAAADWQPPVEGAALTVAQINTLAASLNREVEPVWLRAVLASVNPALGLVEISWDVKHPVPRRLVEQAGQRTGARLGDAAQFILRDTLARAYDEGLDVRTTSALIQAKLSDAAPWQADMLARTDLNSLANGASTAAATEVGMGYKTWLATLDDKTRPEHADADGQVVAINDTFIVGGEDAAYPGDPALSDAMAANCFPAGTRVAGSVNGAFRMPYSGELVTVVTRYGRTLSGTPNHPVLTFRGWKALGLLDESDYLICAGFEERMRSSSPDIEHMPPLIEEVFGSLNELPLFHAERIGGRDVDFHGDISDGDVDVVRTDGFLELPGTPPGFKPGEHLPLSVSDPVPGLFSNESLGMKRPRRILRSSSSRMRETRKSAALSGSHSLHSDPLRFGASATLDTALAEPPFDHWSCGTKTKTDLKFAQLFIDVETHDLIDVDLTSIASDWNSSAAEASAHSLASGFSARGDGLQAESLGIEADQVLSVEIMPWSGFVFTLQTEQGYYIANGVVTLNCRCTVGYADTLGEAEGLIADAGGTIMAGMATKAQRTRRYERRAAHGKPKTETLEALVAAAIPPKSTSTVDRPWDGPANVAKIPNDAGAETLRGMYAFVIPGKDPATKAAYHLPHHEVVDGKPLAANIPGVRNAMGRAAQIKPPLSDADMAGVRAHLQRHLDDFAKSQGNAGVVSTEEYREALGMPTDAELAAARLPDGVKACSLGGNAGYSGGRLCHVHDGTDAGKATAIKKAQADARKMSAQALVASPQPIGFAGTALIEGKVSDDNTLTPRVIMPNSIEWPEMPLSFLAQTQTAEGHDGAEVAGRIDEFSRKKGTGRMQNINLTGEFTNEFGINEIAPMVADKTMRYVSADLGATQWAIVNRDTFKAIPEADLSLDDLQAGIYALACTSGKMKAVTLLPTQAIEGAMIALTASADDAGIGIEPLEPDEMFALVASGQWTAPPERVFRVVLPAEVAIAESDALVASGEQWAPPREWFDMPELPGKMPLTITKDGRVYGHLATWDSCHASFLPSCIPPPKSPSNYAYFHVAELDTSEGDTVTVGKVMFSPTDGGHADRRLSATKASQYYDRTGMAGAYGRVSDGAHGIWFAGAINPRLSTEQRAEMRQELRLNPPSGDWRPINGQYELICALAVAVPGFPTPRTEATIVASGDKIELLDAIIASSGAFEPDPQALFVAARMGIADEDVMAERTMRALAARADGMDALAALAE